MLWRRRATTAASVEQILRHRILPAFGARKMSTIRPSEVQAWVAGLDLAPSTVAVVYGKLASIFWIAVDDRIIARSPCTRIRLPQPDGAEVVPMAPEQVRAMVDAVSDRYRALVLLLAGTGLRPGEALGLTVDRVNFLRRTIRVDRQLVTMANEEPRFGPAQDQMESPHHPGTARRTRRPRHPYRAPPLPPVRSACCSQTPRAIPSDGMLWGICGAVRPLTGVHGFTPHDLRHYAASVLISQGASVKAVQRHLGHGSATTTLDVDAHLFPDSEDITRRALESGLAAIASPPRQDAAADA